MYFLVALVLIQTFCMIIWRIDFEAEMLHTVLEFRPNKKISVFRVPGLKILGRVGTHILFFFWKKIFYAF